jgi:protein-disulfide isomerase
MFKKEIVPVIPSKEMFAGDKDAPIELTVFGDYESAETRHLNQVMKGIMQDFNGKVKFIFRHFPLTQVHQRAHKAAEAAIGAGQEGKFWEMHELLMEHYHQLGITSLKAHAREAGVVNKRFLDQLMNSDFGWNVQDDLREGLALGVREVPALLINGKILEGPLSPDRISKAIQQQLRTDKKSNVMAKKRAA